MIWNKLYDKQAKLDTYITTTHGLIDTSLFEEKFLALLVELGELANETRCFKFWSKKQASERAIILEEYVDNVHFLLSIGLEKGYKYTSEREIEQATDPCSDVTKQFNRVFQHCLQFYNDQTESSYTKMIQQYLHLATHLGFTKADIERAYDKKNEVNYERQEQGY